VARLFCARPARPRNAARTGGAERRFIIVPLNIQRRRRKYFQAASDIKFEADHPRGADEACAKATLLIRAIGRFRRSIYL
jgi:hypothetical protein